MKNRKLRIAWSVACGIACLLLVVLWVRSSSMVEIWNVPVSSNTSIGLASLPGMIAVIWGDDQPLGYDWGQTKVWQAKGVKPPSAIPSWLLIIAAIVCGIAPWIHQLKWRFTLRTLLIGMTLVAVAFGLIVAATR